jgi:phosphatidylglycerol---prolipoprotein diacylglyceryl transferase
VLPYLNLGSWRISSYALCYAIMYGVMGIYIFVRVRRLDVPLRISACNVVLFLLGVFTGSQIGVLFISLRYWLRTGEWFRLGHISALGGLILGVVVAYWAFRRSGVPVGKGFDLGILPVPLGQAIGRLGCLAAGCCGGAPAPAGWGVRMPDEYGVWLYRYPTQPFCLLSDLFIFLVLITLEAQPLGSRWRPFEGFLLVVYVILFSLKRFTVEFFRADYAPILGPFSLVHLATMLLFGWAVWLWLRMLPGRAAEGEKTF